ncbi:HET domain protein [Stipitochalara longipes BDJ]|nr:HET domain protein [Stipitochalara longipes BDJ]
MPRYPYKSLAPQYIRILELHPGPIDAPLVCNILTQQIDGNPYDALSYVWGDPTPVALVKCIDEADEGELGIGHGLAQALIAFRLPKHTRCIWIDALCINQNDVVERQSQVRLMGAVYGNAKYVLCWLGPFNDQDGDEESRARLAIRFLRGFNDNPDGYLQAARDHLHSGEDIEETSGQLLKSWLAIKVLFDLEYFHRAWIIQEVGLAQHARFFWGRQDVWLDWREVATFCSFMDANGASVINALQLKSWVANHINLVWATYSDGKPVHTFVEVLHWARVHRSTDPRDYIYALLSHPSAKVDGKLLVQPNYTITHAQAYIELALNVIERTNSLQILAFVDHHEEAGLLGLPTWVPDWHALNLVAPLRCPTHATSPTADSFSFMKSGNGVVLKCHGIFVDTLRTMSNMVEPSELTVTTLEKEMKKRIPFLIDHIWTKTVVEPGIPLASVGEFLASLSLVLTGGYRDDLDSTSGERQEQQRSDFAAWILEYERIKLPGHSDGFYLSLPPEDKDLVDDMAAKGSAHQFIQDMTWTSMCRKVFRTDAGHIGLGPRIMKEDDVCVVVRGAAYPLILRRCDGSFQLIGPALLYGFMSGEAEQLRLNITAHEKFEII